MLLPRDFDFLTFQQFLSAFLDIDFLPFFTFLAKSLCDFLIFPTSKQTSDFLRFHKSAFSLLHPSENPKFCGYPTNCLRFDVRALMIPILLLLLAFLLRASTLLLGLNDPWNH